MAFTCKLLQMRREPGDLKPFGNTAAPLLGTRSSRPYSWHSKVSQARQRKRYAIFHKEIAATVQRFARTVGDR